MNRSLTRLPAFAVGELSVRFVDWYCLSNVICLLLAPHLFGSFGDHSG